jgi:putative sigma-54 modulation protein
MKTEVIGRNMEITPAIRQYAESKFEKLLRHFDRIQEITLTVVKDNHHHKGRFSVELRVDVEKHEDFISSEKNVDLYAAIDRVVDKGVRQLTDFKERLKQGNR